MRKDSGDIASLFRFRDRDADKTQENGQAMCIIKLSGNVISDIQQGDHAIFSSQVTDLIGKSIDHFLAETQPDGLSSAEAFQLLIKNIINLDYTLIIYIQLDRRFDL